MDIAQEILTTLNDDPHLPKKVITGEKHSYMALKPKLNHYNEIVQEGQDRKKHNGV